MGWEAFSTTCDALDKGSLSAAELATHIVNPASNSNGLK
jgi:hypothetical protein